MTRREQMRPNSGDELKKGLISKYKMDLVMNQKQQRDMKKNFAQKLSVLRVFVKSEEQDG